MAPSHIAPIKRQLECRSQNKSLTGVAYKSGAKNTGDTFACRTAGHGVNQKL